MKHPLRPLRWGLSEAGPIPALELSYSQWTSELLPQAVCRCSTPRACTDRRDQAPAAAAVKAQGAHSQGLGCFSHYLAKDGLQKLSISLPQFKLTAAPQPWLSLTLQGHGPKLCSPAPGWTQEAQTAQVNSSLPSHKLLLPALPAHPSSSPEGEVAASVVGPRSTAGLRGTQPQGKQRGLQGWSASPRPLAVPAGTRHRVQASACHLTCTLSSGCNWRAHSPASHAPQPATTPDCP